MRYLYSFAVWPDETWGFHPALFWVFENISSRLEMDFTEAEFQRFRSELSHDGFTLREVERVPYHEPEPVS